MPIFEKNLFLRLAAPVSGLALLLMCSTLHAAPAGAGTPTPAPAAAPKELATEVSTPKREAARAHFVRGVELYTNGDFPNAWLEFNSAYALLPLVDLLNNLARCEVRMGRPRDALAHFQQFITARPKDPDGEYIRQEISRLEGELGRQAASAPLGEPAAGGAPPPRRFPIYSLMAGATTVALIIAGATTLGLVNSRYNDLQRICVSMCQLADVGVLHDQASAGYGLLGLGAAGAIATGVLLRLELRSNKESALRPIAELSLGSSRGVIVRF